MATHPNPLSNNVRCERELICFQFSCFLAIVITLRLSYIGARALKPSPAWRNTKRNYSISFSSVFPLPEASYINNCLQLPGTSQNTQWYLLRQLSKRAGNNTVLVFILYQFIKQKEGFFCNLLTKGIKPKAATVLMAQKMHN